MGVNLKELIIRKDIAIEDLSGKSFAVDGHNALYQFLSTIRQPDGSPLTDKKGRITSHLNGLFNRCSYLMRQDIKLAFVFDGKVPDLKAKEIARRKEMKIEAQEKFEQAKKAQNVEEMKKYAARTTRLTKEMIDQAKQLLALMGIPVVQAASEGEAQAAYMAKQGDVYAAVSQDYDTLLYETPRLIQNLSVSAKRKLPGKLGYQPVSPQMITLKDALKELGLSQDQLIALAMLVGTDYNPGGIKGIGPKKALALVKKHPGHINTIFDEAKWSEHIDVPWKEIYAMFTSMPVQKDYELKWSKPKIDNLNGFLVEDFGFSQERIAASLEKLEEHSKQRQQRSLVDF